MYNEQQAPAEVHLFNDDLVDYTEASQGQRLLNLLTDTVIAQYVLTYFGNYAVAWVWTAVNEDNAHLYLAEGSDSQIFIEIAISLVILLAYYTCCEKLLHGFTLGKFITGTKAIREDGLPLTWRNALLRTLTRWVPFEPLSALGKAPWHDRWTGTLVIKTR